MTFHKTSLNRLLLILTLIFEISGKADTKIAILDLELNDITPGPNTNK